METAIGIHGGIRTIEADRVRGASNLAGRDPYPGEFGRPPVRCGRCRVLPAVPDGDNGRLGHNPSIRK